MNKFDKFVFFTCVIDNLFLPYFWLISVPLTMPLVFYWFIKRQSHLNKNNEYKLFRIMLIIMCFSSVIGFLIAPEFLYKNIVYLITFTLIFLYYFIFTYYINNSRFNVNNFLIVFIIFVDVLAIFYNFDKALYQNIKLFWNFRSNAFDSSYTGFIGYRYSFIWMDPNNIAYIMNALVLYLWCNNNTNFFVKTFSLFSLLFVLVSCMSSGGFIAFIICASLYLLSIVINLLKGNISFKVRITLINYILFVISVLLILYIIPKIPVYLQTNTALESLERIENNSGESRFIIWKRILNNIDFFEYLRLLIVGNGGVTLVDGVKVSPHNGHLYWIINYGFISYCIFMYIVFRKRRVTPIKNYIWIIPVLIGFTVNVMVGEVKLMGIVFLLIACSTSKKYLNNSFEYENQKK